MATVARVPAPITAAAWVRGTAAAGAGISAAAVAISAEVVAISAGAAIRPAENSSAPDEHDWFGRADVRPNVFKPHLFLLNLAARITRLRLRARAHRTPARTPGPRPRR